MENQPTRRIHTAGPLSKVSRYEVHIISPHATPTSKEILHLIRMLQFDVEILQEAEAAKRPPSSTEEHEPSKLGVAGSIPAAVAISTEGA